MSTATIVIQPQTTADVAVIPRDIAAARLRLREMRKWIDATDDPTLLGEAVQALYEVREWARIRKVATDLRGEATRLEAVALRKLGQMPGAPQAAGINNVWIATANGLASMSDEDFDMLLTKADEHMSPHTLWNIVRKGLARRARFASAGAFLTGGRVPADRDDISDRGIADAARTLLTAALAEGRAFTVAEVTDELVEWIGETAGARDLRGGGSSLIDDPSFRAGMAHVVRQALDSDNDEWAGTARDCRIPAFVTFYDDGEEWTRIPWRNATLDELAQMATHRRKQADDLLRAADELEAVVADLEHYSRSNGGERGLLGLAEIGTRQTSERASALAARLSEQAFCSVCHLTKPCGCVAAVTL